MRRIATHFTHTDLTYVNETIATIIDAEESAIAHRVCVRPGLDDELDKWRETMAHLPSVLRMIAESMLPDVILALEPMYDMGIEYFPQLGYLHALSRTDGQAIDRDVLAAGSQVGWQYQYSSEVKAYFKSERVRELDIHMGDLYSLIAGREIEIVQRLQEEIVKYMQLLTRCGALLAELDCLLSFAYAAQTYDYSRPLLMKDPAMHIVDGRHPLQEHFVDSFIANDTITCGGRGLVHGGGISCSNEDIPRSNSITVITGPNACGKSVYMKQTALIAIMAQVGSFVPARQAMIGIVDKLFMRIQTPESSGSPHGNFQKAGN